MPLKHFIYHRVYSYTLMLSCWEQDPDRRPTFSNVVTSVEKIIAPLADYMDFTDYYCFVLQNDGNCHKK